MAIIERITQEQQLEQHPHGMHHAGQEVVKQNTDNAVTGHHRNFNRRFMAYLTRNLRYVFQLVKTETGALSAELRVQALHSLSYALNVADEWTVARDLLFLLAPKMEVEGHREDWLPYLQQGLTQSIALADERATAECHFQIGLIQRMLSELDLAEEHLLQSVAHFEQLQERSQQARGHNELAWLAQLRHNFEDAEAHVAQAIALVDEDDAERAVSFRVQGMIASGHQDWVAAEALHREALRRFELHGDERRAAWSIQNIGYALHGQKRFVEAIALYLQALEIMERLGDKYHLAIAKMNLGLAYYNTEQPHAALEYYESAVELAKNLRNQLQLAGLQTNFGLAYLATASYENAAACFEYAAQLYNDLGNLDLYINAKDGLALVYLAQQEYDRAIEVIEAAQKLLPQIERSPHFPYLNKILLEHLTRAHERDHSASSSYLF